MSEKLSKLDQMRALGRPGIARQIQKGGEANPSVSSGPNKTRPRQAKPSGGASKQALKIELARKIDALETSINTSFIEAAAIGRPRATAFIGLRLSPELAARLTNRAKMLNIPASAVVRAVLEKELPK